MTTPTITDYLKYANLQMAAEAFLVDDQGQPLTGQLYKDALMKGNNHALRFTETQATAFSAQWKVVAQKANTPTGFSGTLFQSNSNSNEYVISFRSTEFIDDAIRDSMATNSLQIIGDRPRFIIVSTPLPSQSLDHASTPPTGPARRSAAPYPAR